MMILNISIEAKRRMMIEQMMMVKEGARKVEGSNHFTRLKNVEEGCAMAAMVWKTMRKCAAT